jgi:endonuclease/exonuclease/phosphatase family metal-dependent hydrolase
LSGISRAELTIVGLVALLIALFALAARWLPLTNNVVLVIAVFSPYLLPTTLGAVVAFIAARRWALTIVSCAVIVAGLAVQVSWYQVGDAVDQQSHFDVRVFTANVRMGDADPHAFVELARSTADLVAVQELTPEEIRRFSEAGMFEQFPYSLLKPAAGAGGIGLWSRFPIKAIDQDSAPGCTMVSARVRVPGVRNELVFASVHVIAPHPKLIDRWRDGIASAGVLMQRLADSAGAGAAIVAGDFNSTPDMREYRALLTNGYRDGVEQTGAGFAPTYPANEPYPPLITIDHVVTRNATTSSLHSVTVPGSDHRGLIATVGVPVDPTAS